LLTNLSTPASPFFINLRVDSNTENDFIYFVKAAIAAQRLQPVDFFIVGNASIHFATNTRAELCLLFAFHAITYLFLPAYSPELNPCELVFAYIKHHTQTQQTMELQVPQLVLQALAQLSFCKLVGFYDHCVNI